MIAAPVPLVIEATEGIAGIVCPMAVPAAIPEPPAVPAAPAPPAPAAAPVAPPAAPAPYAPHAAQPPKIVATKAPTDCIG
ncbi:hypothetical protein AH547_09745 [Salmonella enterica subsp. enterica]|nr:hypothetical protein [Salmonella enterica subsp. enterica]EBS6328154.1 hypothetical protein [Salmonella enterica subsp. enterica serovar Virchow]EBY6102333.1 hypothetical protein [Salmonella enterica subsp. enterica serovar Nigeria]EBY6724623.1 hypothetical protein [Salmonella enterica subsp. enterica serovar Ndolo]ECC3449536.1 hypothetical protein [Salmonella enterica subsp. enterica serovar Javiana]